MTFILKLDLDMVKMYLHTKTRKYCSRMLTVRRSGHGRIRGVLSRGAVVQGGVWCLGGVVSRGVWCQGGLWCPGGGGVQGGMCPSACWDTPPVKRMTDTCENITLPAM